MSGKTVKLKFITKDDSDKDVFTEIDAPVGMSVLEIAHANEIDLEGACEGSLACATCHVIVEDKFELLEEPNRR